MPCERKHIEAIEAAASALSTQDDRVIFGHDDLLALISTALSAADESPCVWTEDGGCILKTACGRYWQTLEDGDRIDFPHCPYCGRKITEANAASGGGEKEAWDA